MPRAPSKKPISTKTVTDDDIYSHQDEQNIPDSPGSSEHDSVVALKVSNLSKKRKAAADDDEDPVDFRNEMHKMLECFGADMSKTLSHKRKRLEQFTKSSLNTSNRKVDEVLKTQHVERTKLNEEFRRQVATVFQQWDQDLEKAREQDEKLQNVFKQQQKLFQQTRVVQTQRLKTVRQLHEQYIKGMEKLESSHQEQQSSVHGELKKEMSLLQKKILMHTQQQEMANVRKSLQTMLF